MRAGTRLKSSEGTYPERPFCMLSYFYRTWIERNGGCLNPWNGNGGVLARISTPQVHNWTMRVRLSPPLPITEKGQRHPNGDDVCKNRRHRTWFDSLSLGRMSELLELMWNHLLDAFKYPLWVRKISGMFSNKPCDFYKFIWQVSVCHREDRKLPTRGWKAPNIGALAKLATALPS